MSMFSSFTKLGSAIVNIGRTKSKHSSAKDKNSSDKYLPPPVEVEYPFRYAGDRIRHKYCCY
jgi:hypothetical protein